MKLYLGKWQYDLTLRGVKLASFNVYSTSWVKIIR
jgi:hypothetical protein